ncbi:MAG: hypothetical protein M2R45_00594 [Verrucomicrobia subdivision 3 bacterium]|nr:hypothetical protein [Limisphaerales bacterium]
MGRILLGPNPKTPALAHHSAQRNHLRHREVKLFFENCKHEDQLLPVNSPYANDIDIRLAQSVKTKAPPSSQTHPVP